MRWRTRSLGAWISGSRAAETRVPAILGGCGGGLQGDLCAAEAEGPVAGAAAFSRSFPLVMTPPGRLDEAGLFQQHWGGGAAAAGVGALRHDGGGGAAAAVGLGGGGFAASALWTPRAAFAADGLGPLPNACPGEVDARHMPSEIHDLVCPSESDDTASPMLLHTRRTFQPSTLKRKRRHGFLARKSTVGGRRVLARRLLKGRRKLSA